MKVSIIYYTETGNTEAMAAAIVEGIENKGAEANLVDVNDATLDDVKNYDAIALGCPAKGDEEIEDTVFRPFVEEVMDELKNKKVAIFGSYSWNEGEWIETWKAEMEENGVSIIEALKAYDSPDEEAIEACRALGEKLAK
ncbi:MAG: flavodoxin [Ezakiella sp.]|nr:flavodoxin [Ezakiella sp.]MDD7471638.1 flavodoxin [Bacillota bacterium]MDY3923422.1 flavodoxin [Ezakiella sp.]